MTKKTLILLALILTASFVISFLLLTRGQSWASDDFAAYIMQARSIVNGNMVEYVRLSTFTINETISSSIFYGSITYPWGFPLLLSPIYALFGPKMIALKLVCVFCYLFFLAGFFFLARTRLKDDQSLLVTACLAFNPILLQSIDQILSDIPFLFFSTLGIYLIETYRDKEQTVLEGIILGVTIFSAFFIRNNGVLLFAPLVISQFVLIQKSFSDKQKTLQALGRTIIPYVTFGALYLLQKSVFPGVPDSINQFSSASFSIAWSNLQYYFWLPSELFRGVFDLTPLYVIMIIFMAVSLIAKWKRNLSIYGYLFCTIMLYIIFPGIQGLRYIFPILPFIILFAMDGMQLSIQWLKKTYQEQALRVANSFWIGLLIFFLTTNCVLVFNNLAANRNIEGPYDKVSTDMFTFIRKNTPVNSVIIFFKPRVFRLLTDRNTFMTKRCDNLPEANYVVINTDIGTHNQVLPENITTCNPAVKLNPVYTDKPYIVYKIEKVS